MRVGGKGEMRVGKVEINRRDVEEAFVRFDADEASERARMPHGWHIINPQNDRAYPLKIIIALASGQNNRAFKNSPQFRNKIAELGFKTADIRVNTGYRKAYTVGDLRARLGV